MTNNQQKALLWITDILKKHNVPFQIAGGLAAIAYGSTRPLADIDIDIPDDKFHLVQIDVSQYTLYGPSRYKSESWDLLLQTLNYHGQLIDLSGANSTHILNKKTGEWQLLQTELQDVRMINIFGLDLPIIKKEGLISYKSIIARDVDLIDIEDISRK